MLSFCLPCDEHQLVIFHNITAYSFVPGVSCGGVFDIVGRLCAVLQLIVTRPFAERLLLLL